MQILVFGQQAVIVNNDRIHIDVELPSRVSTLIKKIAADYPDLAASMAVSRIAIDHEFADDNAIIQGDEEVALIGLISGG